MNARTLNEAPSSSSKPDALAERVFQSILSTLDIFAPYVRPSRLSPPAGRARPAHAAPMGRACQPFFLNLLAEEWFGSVMDEKVSESFSPDADEVEHLMYGFSDFTRPPDGMSHGHSAGIGTVMRPDTLRGYARQASFDDVEILPVETDFWRFYRLV